MTENESIMRKCCGLSCPSYHVMKCIAQWRSIPQQEWMHFFLDTLDTNLKNWYIELEVRKAMRDWEELTRNFK
jgi:hypothetical protein